MPQSRNRKKKTQGLQKKVRYFYTVGTFKAKATDPFFDHEGYDVRSWSSTDKIVEISKRKYDEYVEEDKKIIKMYKNKYNLELKSFHNPFTRENYEKSN